MEKRGTTESERIEKEGEHDQNEGPNTIIQNSRIVSRHTN